MFNWFKAQGMDLSQALKEMAELPEAKLVDVRTTEEYRMGHVPGSISLPLDSLGRAQKLFPKMDTPLYIYCQSGARSRAACQALKQMGYLKVNDAGGIMSYAGKIER